MTKEQLNNYIKNFKESFDEKYDEIYEKVKEMYLDSETRNNYGITYSIEFKLNEDGRIIDIFEREYIGNEYYTDGAETLAREKCDGDSEIYDFINEEFEANNDEFKFLSYDEKDELIKDEIAGRIEDFVDFDDYIEYRKNKFIELVKCFDLDRD